MLVAAGIARGAGSSQSVSSSVTTVPGAVTLTERQYRWYANEDNLTPTSALAGENIAATTPALGTAFRLRVNIRAEGLTLSAGASFRLQYATATSGPWSDVGTSTPWIFFDNPGVADGQIIVTTVLSDSDLGESYGESNPSAASPNALLTGLEGEWDWAIVNSAAATSSDWYFRMVPATSTALDAYENYPRLAAVAPTPTSPSGGGGMQLPPPTSTSPRPTGTPPFEIIVEPPPPSPCDSPIVARIDLSGDCRIDMTDLSILMYYYNRSGPEIERYDFSANGVVDIFDVSVMMFYWTD